MGKIGAKLNIDFVISTGDNFYDRGLTSVNDPAFVESFTEIYTAHSLQKQWYLGEFLCPPQLPSMYVVCVSVKQWQYI